MQGSRSSSDRRGRVLFALLLGCGLSACATVRPEDKEFLSEPAMTWGSGGVARAHELHVLDNREGASGGTDTKGGGCGCN